MLRGTWGLPRSGIKLVSPALAGRFLTTEPPGKPPRAVLRCVLSPVPCGHPDWWAEGAWPKRLPLSQLFLTPGLWLQPGLWLRLQAATPRSPPGRKSSVAGCPASGPFLACPPGAALSSHAMGCMSPCVSHPPAPVLPAGASPSLRPFPRVFRPPGGQAAVSRQQWRSLFLVDQRRGLGRGRGAPALLCSRLRRPPHTRPRLDNPGFALHLCALGLLPG